MSSESLPPDPQPGEPRDLGDDQGEVLTCDYCDRGVHVSIDVKYPVDYVAAPAPTFHWEHPQDGTADYALVRWEELGDSEG